MDRVGRLDLELEAVIDTLAKVKVKIEALHKKINDKAEEGWTEKPAGINTYKSDGFNHSNGEVDPANPRGAANAAQYLDDNGTTSGRSDERERGGTGRRTGFRFQRPRGHEGSTPSVRTMKLLLLTLALAGCGGVIAPETATPKDAGVMEATPSGTACMAAGGRCFRGGPWCLQTVTGANDDCAPFGGCNTTVCCRQFDPTIQLVCEHQDQ